MNQLEEMASFFDRRVEGYEAHMMQEVDGASEYYRETALLVPVQPDLKLLDLGCGTGLELDYIFPNHPGIQVTGVDLSTEMLAALRRKHGHRALTLIQGSYFDVDLGEAQFDCALSVQTMHHFPHEQKIGLYKKLYAALKPGGLYIETDYTAPDQQYEDFYFAECRRLRAEQGITSGFYHYDTPCTVENQLRLFRAAGFSEARLHWRLQGTAIMVAQK